MGPPRARARVACQRCNGRKVKCDVAETAAPCSNCRQDGEACVVLPRKKHRPRRKRNASGELVSDGEVTSSPSVRNSTKRNQTRYSRISTSNDLPRHNATPVADETVVFDNGIEDQLSLEDPNFDPSQPEALQQARAAMPIKLPTHKPHVIEYLRQQGVYNQLPKDVSDELLRCYFQHVHFFLPILDVPAFLNEYYLRGPQKINPLLLWSVFLASANFADIQILRRAGFSSRKAMKTAMYDRAKCLYDHDQGTDKLTLIRSVILLAFWYSDPQDHTGAWYWIGIAISLAQAINIHRASSSNSRSQKSTPNPDVVSRRIWWSLVVRDRWVALAKGRPIRIRSDSHDVAVPSREDVLSELNQLGSQTLSQFIPRDALGYTDMWLRMVRISDVLGSVLQLHYRIQGPEPSMEELNHVSMQLDQLAVPGSITGNDDQLHIHSLQIELLYHGTVAILYRPYVLLAAGQASSGRDQQWSRSAVRRGREAASNTNSILEQLIELDGIKYLKPMMITAMVPATQIHLVDCKSENALTRGLGRNKLQLCMLVFADLRATYWSADVMYRLFQRAQMLLADQDGQPDAHGELPLRTGSPEGELEQASEQLLSESQQSRPLVPEPAIFPVDAMIPFVTGPSPQFSDVDQLLSPGFALSEDMFLEFFPNYAAGNYDQPVNPNYY